VLEALKIFNPEAHALLKGMTENYLSADDDLKRQKEWERLTQYLKKLHEDLQNHKVFASQLNERLYSLLVQTVPYRNGLCKQVIPNLFN
jgi:hypothetical protein